MRWYTFKQQFRVMPDQCLADGASVGPRQIKELARGINNAAGCVTGRKLVNVHRKAAVYADVATTTKTLIKAYPATDVPDGLAYAIALVRAHRRSAAGSAPSLIIHSDYRSPLQYDGTSGVSVETGECTVTVQSTEYTLYGPVEIGLMVNARRQTYLSIWGQAATAGSNDKQAEYTDLDIYTAVPYEPCDVLVEPPPVAVWR